MLRMCIRGGHDLVDNSNTLDQVFSRRLSHGGAAADTALPFGSDSVSECLVFADGLPVCSTQFVFLGELGVGNQPLCRSSGVDNEGMAYVAVEIDWDAAQIDDI